VWNRQFTFGKDPGVAHTREFNAPLLNKVKATVGASIESVTQKEVVTPLSSHEEVRSFINRLHGIEDKLRNFVQSLSDTNWPLSTNLFYRSENDRVPKDRKFIDDGILED
jgi:hypothetical protein